jgi:hypothetical protein
MGRGDEDRLLMLIEESRSNMSLTFNQQSEINNLGYASRGWRQQAASRRRPLHVR